ncbi:MSO1 (YNR049C) [Zygosaccharomyces parabailii]|uniref:BN860_00738g1_1 n=1 Tax=Zygosaccharomyces bailii (strain CLIB 213 / ATCC 58445 / CBS 680 / BCRC 21525 / NBRC 1098 / NCYC 1416 / NRRL Y-2227) TaxID=1333698 RepID=A0A8J2T4I1_ZYGB2|nr:MSO1 (YNR049C) [Zygosaccharomyces parabailii]CDF88032.1 BN860_00738g1_1 [Zygosaccharomyces bailii CLIB 213]CDH14445.1 related to Protein MSO1 [Zygosaccharomyces bailii ISA1307]SJM87339.1 related to protein MSO1 [Zygosaccharomyces bailii]
MSASTENSQNIWHKFRSSTKNLSSSFSGLSMKSESDGDTPNSTLVHKSLVKFYKNQEPFTGFPGWLGEKEDLPNEQKILKRQSEGKPSNSFSSWGSVKRSSRDRSMMSSKENSAAKESPKELSSDEKERRPTAGMSFQTIYNKQSQPSAAVPVNTAEGAQPLKGAKAMPPTHGHSVSEGVNEQKPGAPARSNTSSSSMMMRDRLKRTNTKTSLNF